MKIVIFGRGRMGTALRETAVYKNNIEILDIIGRDSNFSSLPKFDMILDFTRPEMAMRAAEFAKSRGVPFLSGTTGFTFEEEHILTEIAKEIPLLISSNFSLGTTVLLHMLKDLPALVRKEWDIELIETHHRGKEDAPSGTAKTMLAAIDPENSRKRVYGRQGFTGERTREEIGVHVLRGGSVIGEHNINFYGPQETLTFTHKADTRHAFAEGAWYAAEKLVCLPKGRHTLEEIIFG